MKNSNLKELLENYEKKIMTKDALLSAGCISGTATIFHTLIQGEYEIAIMEGLVSIGFITYSRIKGRKIKKYKQEIIDNYDIKLIK